MGLERKTHVHAKPMVKDVHRHTPAKAKPESIEMVHIQMNTANVLCSSEREALTFLDRHVS